MNIAYLHGYFNANLPADSLNTLTFDKVQHVTETKDKVIELIFRPNVNTTNFGLNSFCPSLEFPLTNGMILSSRKVYSASFLGWLLEYFEG